MTSSLKKSSLMPQTFTQARSMNALLSNLDDR
jgi:hypothetical protein